MKREPTSPEEAIDLFVASRRAGEDVDAATFAEQYAHLGPEVGLALESLLALEMAEHRTRPDDEAADLQSFGPYRVLREIGRGGMGVVYEALEEPLGRRVALKVLPPQSLSSPSARGRFRREAELAARLDHSGIATVYGAGVDGERPWIAMRFVEGQSLAEKIAAAREAGAHCVDLGAQVAKEKSAVLAVAACLARVARALEAAHAQGVVHRDVKASNVVVSADGMPVLVDFGLAITEDSSGHTVSRTGETAGTPAYLAPEIVGGERARPDAQTDVYALGVTLYECLVLRRPFDAPTPVALYRAIVTDSPSSVRALNRAVPADLALVTAVAIERDRGLRYSSAAALADDLEACVEGRPIRARPVPITGRIARWMRREPRQALLASALLVALVGLGAFAGTWWSSRGEVHAAAEVARLRARDDALARGFVLTRDHARARAEFDRARALDPESLDALAGQVMAEIDAGRRPSASQLLATAPQTMGFDALRQAADRHGAELDVPSPDLERASALDLYLLAYVLLRESNSTGLTRASALRQRANNYVEEAILRSREARQIYHTLRANIVETMGDPSLAKSAAAALLSLWPESPTAWLSASTALRSADPEASIRLLERVTRADPRNPYPFVLLGQCLTDLGRLDEAEESIREARAIECSASADTALGVVLFDRGCYEDSRATLSHAFVHGQARLETWNDLALVSWRLKDDELALECFRQSVAIDPWYGGAHEMIGKILSRAGQFEAARPHLAQAVAMTPASAEAWEWFSYSHDALGDRDGAITAVEAGLQWSPRDQRLLEMREGFASER